MPSISRKLLLCCSVFAAGAGACEVARRPLDGKSADRKGFEVLRAQRGEFTRRLSLTGEVDAVAAIELKVPRVPTGKVGLRKLMAEGAEVKAGEVVARLDSNAFVQQIKDLTLQLSQAEIDLERQLSQNGVMEADRALDVERKRAILKRAEVDADVPEGILPKRDFLEKKLTVRRAQVEVERAEAALAAQRTTAATDVKLKRIALEKLRRAVAAAEEAIATLTLKATADGTVLLGDHQEERRKVQEGDELFMGMVVARVASARSRRVRAWLVDVDDGKVAAGMPAVVTLDAHPGRTFSGVVRDVSPVAQTQGQGRMQGQRRVFTVGIELHDNDAGSDVLRPGLSARAEVVIDHQPAALLVPRVALDLTGDEPRVLLASGEARPVALKGCNAEACVVGEGVDERTPLRRATP
jgi:multidrug resistance efflux pump